MLSLITDTDMGGVSDPRGRGGATLPPKPGVAHAPPTAPDPGGGDGGGTERRPGRARAVSRDARPVDISRRARGRTARATAAIGRHCQAVSPEGVETARAGAFPPPFPLLNPGPRFPPSGDQGGEVAVPVWQDVAFQSRRSVVRSIRMGSNSSRSTAGYVAAVRRSSRERTRRIDHAGRAARRARCRCRKARRSSTSDPAARNRKTARAGSVDAYREPVREVPKWASRSAARHSLG